MGLCLWNEGGLVPPLGCILYLVGCPGGEYDTTLIDDWEEVLQFGAGSVFPLVFSGVGDVKGVEGPKLVKDVANVA